MTTNDNESRWEATRNEVLDMVLDDAEDAAEKGEPSATDASKDVKSSLRASGTCSSQDPVKGRPSKNQTGVRFFSSAKKGEDDGNSAGDHGGGKALEGQQTTQRHQDSNQPGAHAVEGAGTDVVELMERQSSCLTGSTLSLGTGGEAETSDSSDGGGMAQAVPVPEEDTPQDATPVPQDKNEPRIEISDKGDSVFKKTGGFLVCAVLVVGIAALILALLLGGKGGNEDPDLEEAVLMTTPAQVPSSAPTGGMTEPLALELEDLPSHTLKALQDPSSPQAMAYDWLLKNPLLDSYPGWRKVQRFALATFYFSTGGPGWEFQDNWLNVTMPECQWFFRSIIGSPEELGAYGDQVPESEYHVDYTDSACTEDGRYKILVFPNNNLVGTIPPEISLLSSGLEVLRLSENELVGTIPTEIGLLTDLKRLYTEINGHTGIIPTELGMLSQLEELDLGYNPFSGSIPTQLGNLGESLKLLSIKRSGITGFLPTELYLLTTLEILFINGNRGLTGGNLTSDIGNMRKLQRFIVCQVPYSTALPSEFGLLSDLWELNLWYTRISGSIPSELWQLTNMQYLDFGTNKLTGTFPAQLSKLSNLKKTYVNGNQFSGQIPGESFENLGQLTLLKMTDNYFSGTIPTQVGRLSSMEKFSLNMNQNLTGPIPTEMAQMTKLEQVLFHNTSLTGTLPSELGLIPSLELLDVSNTTLTGSIPSNLCDSVRDYEYECYVHLGLYEICWDKIRPVNFSCHHSMLCGCDCEACS